jgi:phosphatidylserine synthase
MTISFLLILLAGAAGLALLALTIVIAVLFVLRVSRSQLSTGNFSANQTEGTISILAALCVLFSAMLNPVLSVGLAVVFLLALAVYKLLPQR